MHMHLICRRAYWYVGMGVEQDMHHHSDEILKKLVEALLESFKGLLCEEEVGEEVPQSEENAYQSWN